MIKLRTTPGSGFEIPVSKRSLEIAQASVRTWIPVNPRLLASLQQRIQSGEFKNKEERLYRELRNDIGLYLHTLFQIITTEGLSSPTAPESILGCVERATVSEINNLISGVPASFGDGEISGIGKYQAQVIRFVFVAGSSAVLMAERAGVDPGMTYALSLLRNLANLVISWSYPAAFNRAAESWSQGLGNLSTNLERNLNASVLEIVFLMIRGLRLGDKVSSVVLNPGDIAPMRNEPSGDESGRSRISAFEKAVRFCEIGEALARLSDSENHPMAVKEWRYVNAEVTYYLGKHGIDLVNERVTAASEHYLSLAPEVFQKLLDPERAVPIAIATYNLHRFNRATHFITMGERTRDVFESVYKLMEFEKLSREALKVIFSDVLQDLEFERGGLFLYDRDKDALLPKNSFGNDEWGFSQPVFISTVGELPRLLYESRTSASPLRLDRLYSDNVTRSYLAWKIGNKEFEGVIYLGYGQALRVLPARTVLSYFSLVRQAVCDALFIENDSLVLL